MKFQGAVIKEQDVTFAIVVVKQPVVQNQAEANRTMQSFSSVFPGIPIVLMAQDSRGTPIYYGRDDLVRFLANIPIDAITWQEYTLN